MSKKVDNPVINPDDIEVKVIHNPVVKTVPKVQPLTDAPDNGFKVPNGWYHLIKITPGGAEMLGTDVAVSPRDFKRTFEKLVGTQYIVKKNPS